MRAFLKNHALCASHTLPGHRSCSIKYHFIHVPFQHFEAYTALQPFRRWELIVHNAISVVSGTHLHLIEMKHGSMGCPAQGQGGGPRVGDSTAAFHARVRGSVPGLGGLKETKNVSSPSTCESQYCGEPP